jgi:hypothetical protein
MCNKEYINLFSFCINLRSQTIEDLTKCNFQIKALVKLNSVTQSEGIHGFSKNEQSVV